MLSPGIETAGSSGSRQPLALDAASIAPMCHPPQTLLLVCTPSPLKRGSSVPARRAANGRQAECWLALPAEAFVAVFIPYPAPQKLHDSPARPSPVDFGYGLVPGEGWHLGKAACTATKEKEGTRQTRVPHPSLSCEGRQRRETSRAGLPVCK